ncbi:transposase (plasmid) [Streptomyces sp. NBC_01320]|nr:transposase [Streptomyces sp. NBC_01320]
MTRHADPAVSLVVALSKLINSLKGGSSRYLRAEYTGRINRIGMGSVFWSRSYFAESCGGAPLTVPCSVH